MYIHFCVLKNKVSENKRVGGGGWTDTQSLAKSNLINKKSCTFICLHILYTNVTAWFNYDKT